MRNNEINELINIFEYRNINFLECYEYFWYLLNIYVPENLKQRSLEICHM